MKSNRTLFRSLPIAAATLAALLYTAAPSNAQTPGPAAGSQPVKAQAKADEGREVSVKVKRNGVMEPLELVDKDGLYNRLRAQKLPSFALAGSMPVVVTLDDSFCIDGKFVSYGGRRSGIKVSGAEGYPADKKNYLDDKCLSAPELSNLLGNNNYTRLVLDVRSESQPGESLKLPVVVTQNAAGLVKKIQELNEKYGADASKYSGDIAKLAANAEAEKEALKAQMLNQNNELVKRLEERYNNQLKVLGDECARKLEELGGQYTKQIDALLKEVRSEKFLTFAGYQLGNLTNVLGQGLKADLRMQGPSFQGAFNSRNFFADLEAELSSGRGNVNQNGNSMGSMDLTRNIFKVNGQYAVFHVGSASGGISAAYVYDKMTKRGYLINLKNPNDPSKRNNFAGNGEVTQEMVGGFVSGSTDSSRVSVAGHYGTSNLRGREFNLRASGLVDGILGAAVASVDVTRYDGSAGYPAGTEFDVNASVAFTKGYKGIRPAVMTRFRQNGDNHDASVALGLSKSFGKSPAGIKYTP